MSKELEALDKIYFAETNDGRLELFFQYASLIKKALKRLEAIDNANPSEALEYLEQFLNEMTYCLEHPKEYAKGYERQIFWKFKNTLETTIKQALLKAQEQEKENELLKEIIKSLFDRGCPLYQYTDKEGVLTIEVDDECSIMCLGEFKGFDLDKKLKEVLDNE